MGFFKSDEVIDYTYLQKRGLLKLPKEQETNENKVIDYTSSNPVNPIASSNESTTNSNPLGSFFDSANAFQNTSPTNTSNSTSNSDEIATLRVKLDDLEYKFERAMERIAELENNRQ